MGFKNHSKNCKNCILIIQMIFGIIFREKIAPSKRKKKSRPTTFQVSSLCRAIRHLSSPDKVSSIAPN